MIEMGSKYGNISATDILSSRTKIGGDILDKAYDKKVAELKEDLLKVKRCRATMDFGKENMNNIDFVDLTVHFINEVRIVS